MASSERAAIGVISWEKGSELFFRFRELVFSDLPHGQILSLPPQGNEQPKGSSRRRTRKNTRKN
jgi:hypothetical protein